MDRFVLLNVGKAFIMYNLKKMNNMIITTTPQIEGHPVKEYKGVVTGETIIGANFVKDLFASIRDVIGGRSGSYEKVCARQRRHRCRKWRSALRNWGLTR